MTKIWIATLASACLLSACTKAPEAASAASSSPAASPASSAAGPANLPTYFEAINQFDPATQHFIWVLPEGVHGVRPWTMHVTIKEKGDLKYDTSFPLVDAIVPASTFPELPPNSEVVRLSDDGSWNVHMAEVKRKIDELIAQFGRGGGELLMESELHTTIDDAHQKMYCTDGVKPQVRFYLEEAATKKLAQFSFGPMAPMFEAVILKGCKA